MTWITLDEVKNHLRYDDDANDANLTMYLHGAMAAINNHITIEPVEPIPHDIKVATLMMVGYYDENRSADKDTPTNGNYLPMPVVAMLYPYRTPTVA